MASNYNGSQRPAVILVNEGRARVIIERETYADLVAKHWNDLPGLFITSQVDDQTGPPVAGQEPAEGSVYHEGEGSAIHIVAGKAAGTKCDRCWRYVPAVSSAPGREGVCPRCEDALAAAR
jgi:isoleucyl-tRNA synthetase